MLEFVVLILVIIFFNFRWVFVCFSFFIICFNFIMFNKKLIFKVIYVVVSIKYVDFVDLENCCIVVNVDVKYFFLF